jgi:diaminopimelate epimerase
VSALPTPLAEPGPLGHHGGVSIPFWKYEGLGNDFLIVFDGAHGAHAAHFGPERVAATCDRHFGVGGDGVLITGLDQGRPYMRVINADGSVPEMCGNGLRCVALFLVEHGYVAGHSFEIDTGAGPHPVEVDAVAAADGSRQVLVQMRRASLDAGDVLRDAHGLFLDRPFNVDGRALALSCVSMGNPHAVLFDVAPTRAEMESLGPRIERDPRFRAGANVGFAQMVGPGALDLTVWERGVGFTLACGTGACAAAVAAVETGRAQRNQPLRVRLPGGALTIRVGERDAPIAMRGPARAVFAGQLPVR